MGKWHIHIKKAAAVNNIKGIVVNETDLIGMIFVLIFIPGIHINDQSLSA